MSAKTSAV